MVVSRPRKIPERVDLAAEQNKPLAIYEEGVLVPGYLDVVLAARPAPPRMQPPTHNVL